MYVRQGTFFESPQSVATPGEGLQLAKARLRPPLATAATDTQRAYPINH